MGVASYYICMWLIGPEVANKAKLEQGCAAYVSRAVPPIVSHWSIEQWKARATTEQLAATNIKKLTNEFATNRKYLGEFRGMDNPTGYVVVDNSGGVPETIGYYSTRARFRMGSADLTMRLVKRGGGWKFQKFNIRTDAVDPEL